MIRGKGSLDEFLHAVFNLNPDEQQVVLYECDESEFYGFERSTLKNILVGSRLTSDRCRVISDGKDLEGKVFREDKAKNGIIQKY